MNYFLLGLAIAAAAYALHSLGLIVVASFGRVQFKRYGWLVWHIFVASTCGAGAAWLCNLAVAA